VPEALDEYIRCIKNPRTFYAMREDYRATVSCDLDMDTVDFNAGKRVTCPIFLLWGATGGVGRNHGARDVWSKYATNIVGALAAPAGHCVREEAPKGKPSRRCWASSRIEALYRSSPRIRVRSASARRRGGYRRTRSTAFQLIVPGIKHRIVFPSGLWIGQTTVRP
jgi:hypothetical protein